MSFPSEIINSLYTSSSRGRKYWLMQAPGGSTARKPLPRDECLIFSAGNECINCEYLARIKFQLDE